MRGILYIHRMHTGYSSLPVCSRTVADIAGSDVVGDNDNAGATSLRRRFLANAISAVFPLNLFGPNRPAGNKPANRLSFLVFSVVPFLPSFILNFSAASSSHCRYPCRYRMCEQFRAASNQLRRQAPLLSPSNHCFLLPSLRIVLLNERQLNPPAGRWSKLLI